ncbi:uncharacterized protein UHOD_04628 [Ustilago sp. UG-2017b]|nr:uncharacterized protein UHOD_04628 [Ustilago sp. UG-2017b]
MDTGGFSSSQPAAGQGGTRLPGLAGTESAKQLTQRELAALKTMKRNVSITKYGGWMVGAAGTYVLLNRRKPRPRLLARMGLSVVGGFGGSFLMIPIGILLSKNVLRDVEDPQHLRRVMLGAMEEQRQGKRPQIGVAPLKGLNGEADFDQGLQQQQQQGGEGWGGERAATSYPEFVGNNGNSSGSFSSSFPSLSSEPSSSSAQESTTPPPGTGTGTRWAQLQGERGVEPSKWERIRQDNARTTYNRSNASPADQPQSDDPSAFNNNPSQPSTVRQQPPPPNNGSYPSRSASPRNRDEPVMTLSGAEDDPRWSSPATFSPQSSGWSNGEFVDDPTASSSSSGRRSARRGYGILSVLEEPSSGFQIESDAPVQVVKGSLLAALVGGVGGSIYGVLNGKQGAGTVLGTRMAFSSFAFAFPFFAVREYIVSPVLNRTSSGPDFANRHMRLRTVTKNKHMDKLLASGLAGAVVGAGAAAFTRGPQAIHKGLATLGVACMGLQLTGNELRVVRDAVIRPSPRGAPLAVPELMKASSTDAAVSASQAVAPMADVQPTPQVNQEGGKGWLEKVKGAMPIRSVSDEEYEQKLKERLSGVNQRMADVETEIREIEGLIAEQQSKQGDSSPSSS